MRKSRLLRIESESFVIGAIVYRTGKGQVAFAKMAPLMRKLFLNSGKNPEEFIRAARARSDWKSDWI